MSSIKDFELAQRIYIATHELKTRIAELERERDAVRTWLDSNTTFYDVDADWPVEEHNIPVLAQVSNRIWYHATDDCTSYPFSAVVDAATGKTQPIAPAIDAARSKP